MPGRTNGPWGTSSREREDGGWGRERKQEGWRRGNHRGRRQGCGGGNGWGTTEPQQENAKPGDGWAEPGDPWLKASVDTKAGESGAEPSGPWSNSAGAWGLGSTQEDPNAWGSAWMETPIKIETMEDLLKSQAQHAEDFMKDLVPFWLKSVDAAERGEPEVKLETYLDEKIRERQASGWYYTSPMENKDGDGWSNHKASENGGWGDWRATGNGWGVPEPQNPSAAPHVTCDAWGEPEPDRVAGVRRAGEQKRGWDVVERAKKPASSWKSRAPRSRQNRFG